jgi:hypothetical protein
MSLSHRTTAHRAVRPSCDLLEARALLSAMMIHSPHVTGVAAEVASPRAQRVQGIVPNLPATADASISTIPANGDVNPYGVAFVPRDFPRGGLLHPGSVLVANFNASSNLQGTGTTIVQINPAGPAQAMAPVFFTSKEVGLATGLGVLRAGFVVVGNVPTTDGTFGTIGAGSIQVIDRFGNQVLKLADPKLLNSPWDLTVHDEGDRAQVFVSNAISGTVTRIDLKLSTRHDTVKVLGMTQIASGFTASPNATAFVLAPTGLAFDNRTDTLFVASTGDNAIYAIANAEHRRSDAGIGKLVTNDATHLNGPVGLVLAPNGDLLTTNGDSFNPSSTVAPSLLLEFTTKGQFVGSLSLDPKPDAGFGLDFQVHGGQITLATANDNTNNLDFRTIPFHGGR